MRQHKFIINFELAPGDITVSTALARDLKLSYGDQVAVDFRTNFPSIFKANPHVTKIADDDPDAVSVTLDYRDGIISSQAGNKHHFLTWFHRHFTECTGVSVPPRFAKPDLHLTKYEKDTPPISGRYWLMFAGGKRDIIVKHWDYDRYQEVADTLTGQGVHVVQSGADRMGHLHASLDRVTSVVGWGGVRELIWQIYHSEGVIGPVTCATHMAAAFDKPCVVIAGGREEPWWAAYTNEHNSFGPAGPVVVEHKFLHTIGQLDCCKTVGCWKRQVVPDDVDGEVKHNCLNIIERPIEDQQQPRCMSMITADDVVNAVMSYYEEGILPPVAANSEVPRLVVPNAKRQTHEHKVIGDVYIPS